MVFECNLTGTFRATREPLSRMATTVVAYWCLGAIPAGDTP